MENYWLKSKYIKILEKQFLIASIKLDTYRKISVVNVNNGFEVRAITTIKGLTPPFSVFEGSTAIETTNMEDSETNFKHTTGYSKSVMTLLLKKSGILLLNPFSHRKPVAENNREHPQGYQGFLKDLAEWQKYDPMVYTDPFIIRLK